MTVVDGETWKIFALFVGPPLLIGAAIWGYRRFVAVADHRAVEPMTATGPPADGGGSSVGALEWKPRVIGIALIVSLGGAVIWGIPKLYSVARGASSARETQLSDEQLAPLKRNATAAELENSLAESSTATRTLEPPLPNLDRILAFESPADCGFGPNLRDIADMITTNTDNQILPGSPFRVQGYNEILTPTYSRAEDGLVTATIPLTGMWHGLRVSRIYSEIQFHQYLEIRFLEPPERIRQVLNESGFVLPAVGERQLTSEPDEMDSWQAVIALPGGGALACF